MNRIATACSRCSFKNISCRMHQISVWFYLLQALKLSISALHGTTTGNIVNLVSSDAQKFDWVSSHADSIDYQDV